MLAQGAFCNANLLKKPKFLGRKYARHTLNGIDKLSSIDENNQWLILSLSSINLSNIRPNSQTSIQQFSIVFFLIPDMGCIWQDFSTGLGV